MQTSQYAANAWADRRQKPEDSGPARLPVAVRRLTGLQPSGFKSETEFVDEAATLTDSRPLPGAVRRFQVTQQPGFNSETGLLQRPANVRDDRPLPGAVRRLSGAQETEDGLVDKDDRPVPVAVRGLTGTQQPSFTTETGLVNKPLKFPGDRPLPVGVRGFNGTQQPGFMTEAGHVDKPLKLPDDQPLPAAVRVYARNQRPGFMKEAGFADKPFKLPDDRSLPVAGHGFAGTQQPDIISEAGRISKPFKSPEERPLPVGLRRFIDTQQPDFKSEPGPSETTGSQRDNSLLPVAVNRFTEAQKFAFKSETGLVDNTTTLQGRPRPRSGVDADIPAPALAASAPTTGWTRGRLPSFTRGLGHSARRYSDESAEDSGWLRGSEDAGPPLPVRSRSASRSRTERIPLYEVADDQPPWWWFPCYHEDPDTPWYDSKEKFGENSFWNAGLSADHLYIACKMAVSDAIEIQEKQFVKAWGKSLKELQEMFHGMHFDWMPKVPKKPEKPVDSHYYINSKFRDELIGSHRNLQIVSVPVDQIIREQQKNNGDFLPVWFSVKTHLRQVLCEAECGLFHMKLPKEEVPRSTMPDSLRGLCDFEQQARDWIVFRDYKNLMQFYEQVFLRHAFYK